MTAKPITPHEDVEALANICDDVYENGIMCADKCPSFSDIAIMLRAILAERDEAYRRGQRDMRNLVANWHAEQSKWFAAPRQHGSQSTEEIAKFKWASSSHGAHYSYVLRLPVKEYPDA